MNENASGCILLAAITFLFVALFCVVSEKDDLKSEAVKRGFAEWAVDAEGGTTFRWKEDGK